jgi:hypothetical protein
LNCENFQTKSIISKKITQEFSSLNLYSKKGLQRFIKFLPNWTQNPTPIHFPSLCCHPSISVLRIVVEIESYLVLVAHLSCLVNHPLFLSGLVHLLQPPKGNSRSRVHVTICHALLRPSATPHVSRSHLHVKHSRCTFSSPYNRPTTHFLFLLIP